MAKTNFSYGDVVNEAFFDSIYLTDGGHKHDGVDDDGHCSPIPLDNHASGGNPAHVTGILPYLNLPMLRMLGYRKMLDMASYNSGDAYGITLLPGVASAANSGSLSGRTFTPLIINTSTFIKLAISSSGDSWSSWQTGSGNGGIPTIASGWSQSLVDGVWLHVFLLCNIDTPDTCEVGYDVSVTAVNLREVSGYTYYRRIGSVLIESLGGGKYGIVSFNSINGQFRWVNDSLPKILNYYNTTFSETNALLDAPIPPDVVTNVLLQAKLNTTTNSNSIILRLYDAIQEYATMTSSSTCSIVSYNSHNAGEFKKMSDTQQHIKAYYARGGTGDIDYLYLICLGWDEI